MWIDYIELTDYAAAVSSHCAGHVFKVSKIHLICLQKGEPAAVDEDLPVVTILGVVGVWVADIVLARIQILRVGEYTHKYF